MAQIDKTEIKAPFDGIIGLRNIYEGSYVSPSIEIASIQDINPVKIDFSVPEKYSEYIHIGDRIEFTLEGSMEQFSGKVYAIEPKVDELTRTIHIRAVCTNAEERILPGSFAKIHLVLNKIDNAVMIPTQSVLSILYGQRVFKYRHGKAVAQDVKTGIRTDTKIQITEGVDEGDTIITTGFMQFRPGDNVRIMSYVNQ
jgi:membrane fusion protein (multidrug efflux system)